MNFIFANSVKRHSCGAENSRLHVVHDLAISVIDRIISPFREDLSFTKPRIMRSFAKTKPSENFRIYSIIHAKPHLRTHLHRTYGIILDDTHTCTKYVWKSNSNVS